jgi:hypothetical protein
MTIESLVIVHARRQHLDVIRDEHGDVALLLEQALEDDLVWRERRPSNCVKDIVSSHQLRAMRHSREGAYVGTIKDDGLRG